MKLTYHSLLHMIVWHVEHFGRQCPTLLGRFMELTSGKPRREIPKERNSINNARAWKHRVGHKRNRLVGIIQELVIFRRRSVSVHCVHDNRACHTVITLYTQQRRTAT